MAGMGQRPLPVISSGVIADADLFREDPALGEFEVQAGQGEAAAGFQALQEIGDVLEAHAQQVALEPAQVFAGQVAGLGRVQSRESLRREARRPGSVRLSRIGLRLALEIIEFVLDEQHGLEDAVLDRRARSPGPPGISWWRMRLRRKSSCRLVGSW